jgi:WD40 repeat protein/serine/threonine protein kinase
MQLALEVASADAAAGERDAGDTPAQTFGPYRLIEKIGEGGMGIVWLARQEQPIRRDVAVKVVKPGANSALVLSRFESERQALAILNHPNIAAVYDAGLTADGRPYFAMEYVPGLPITVFADQRALPIDGRLELFLAVCEAVEHAHQKGVLHRDLKPANILVSDRDGRAAVKVIDFGVAKALGPPLSAETMETLVGSLVGTPEYMSPEQAGLTSSAVDTRTDIYSLGLVLYELLVGALPFDANTLRRKAIVEMLRVIREDEPPRLASRLTSQTDAEIREIARRRLTEPRALVRQLRGDLEWITNRALEKEPARRYASASALGTDIRHHLASEPVAAGPPDLSYRLGKLIRKHRGASIGAAVAILALVAGTVVSSMMWLAAERARADTRRQLVASLVVDGVARVDAWDWSGGLLSFAKALEIESDRNREREHRLRIAQVLQNMPRLVRFWPHGLRVTSVDVSGSTIASAGTDGVVRLWSIDTGQAIGDALQNGAPVNRVVFSPNGIFLASASEDGSARVWRVSDRVRVGPILRHERGVRDVAFSRDSTVLATAGADGRVKLWRIGDAEPYAQVAFEGAVARVVFTQDGARFAAAALAVDRQPFAARLWSTRDGTPAGDWIRGQAGWALIDMDLSPDGAVIATAGMQGCYCARLWDASTGKPIGIPLEHRNSVSTVRFNAQSSQVVTGGFDRVVRVWSVPSAEPAAPAWTVTGWPEFARFIANGQVLVATADGGVEIMIPGSGGHENSRLFPTFAHAGPVTSATLDASGRFLITASADGGVRVWDLAPALVTEPPFAWYASEWIDQILFARDGHHLASGARIFDTTSGLPVVPPLRADANDFHIAFSRDDRHIATAGSRVVRVWDTTTGEPVSPALTHRADLWYGGPLAFSDDGRRLVTLSNPDGAGEAAVWDAATGTRLNTLKHDGRVTAAAFSSDGARLMTASAERHTNLRIWNLDRGTVEMSASHPDGVFSAAFNSSDARILTVGFDQRVLEWRVGTELTSSQALELRSEPTVLAFGRDGTVVAGGRGGDVRARTIRAGAGSVADMSQSGAVMSADISPDGQWLVASGDDGRTNLWNLRTGDRLAPAHRSGGPVYSARFSPDGASFAIGSSGTHIREFVPDERPAWLLTDLAELLSARRLVNAAGHPLRLEELHDRWMRLSSVAAPDNRSSASWHRRQAALAMFRGNPRLALDQLASARKTSPPSWTDTMISLSAMARAGQWREASQEVHRLDAARDAAPELSFVEAVSRQRAGELDASLAVCRDLLSRHAATRNPDRALWILRTCLLDPQSPTLAGWNATAHLVDQLIDLHRYGTRESLAGAVSVRSGRFAEAIDLLQRAATAGEGTPHTMLFLAMAFAGEQKPAEARRWLRASGTFVWPSAGLQSQQAFRDSWFDAEAAILREQVARVLTAPSERSNRSQTLRRR